VTEDFLTFYADPGEDFGWAVGCGTTLVSRGITKMWTTADILWEALNDGPSSTELLSDVYLRDDVNFEDYGSMEIKRIVCENFRIYPWAAKDLAWDEVRTARVIGAMTFMARLKNIPFITQPAAIKAAAVAAGAEELFDRPLHENRHSNDAIMHYTFYTATELLGLAMPVPAANEDKK
jgi:hypothetical protein